MNRLLYRAALAAEIAADRVKRYGGNTISQIAANKAARELVLQGHSGATAVEESGRLGMRIHNHLNPNS
jgi:glucuronate isomerase